MSELDTFRCALKLEQEGKQDDAIAAYSDFITQCSSRPDEMKALQKNLALAYNNRGFLNYLKVEFRQAVDDYTKALSHDADLAVSYYNRGLIHYRLARFPAAVEDMKKALALKPDMEPAQKCLQQSLQDLETRDASVK